MNFLVDAHLPRRLALWLREIGHDAIHTLDLPHKNQTTDVEINAVSLRENRVVITKDADFINSFLLLRQPYKLLVVSTGNIPNVALEEIFIRNISAITSSLEAHHYIELTRTALVIHQ